MPKRLTPVYHDPFTDPSAAIASGVGDGSTLLALSPEDAAALEVALEAAFDAMTPEEIADLNAAAGELDHPTAPEASDIPAPSSWYVGKPDYAAPPMSPIAAETLAAATHLYFTEVGHLPTYLPENPDFLQHIVVPPRHRLH